MKITNYNDILRFEETVAVDLPSSIYDMFLQSASKYKNDNALRFFLQGKKYKESYDWTYSQLLEEINATTNLFYDLGVRNTDVVSYILPNSPATVFTLFAAEISGIANPVNPLLESAQILEILKAAETKVLVTLAPFPKVDIWEKVEKIIDQIPSLETVILVNMGEYLKFPLKQVINLTRKKINSVPQKNIKVIDFHKAQKTSNRKELNFTPSDNPDKIVSFFHTGGTTGRPKIAKHTQRNELFNAWTITECLGSQEHYNVFCGLPWFHVNGVVATGTAMFMSGNTLVLGTPAGYREAGVIPNFWKIVEHYRLNFFSAVPTVLQYLLSVPVANDISSLQFAVCGAAPLSLKLMNDFEKKFNLKVIEGYGFTEGGCVNAINPLHGNRKVGSIGMRLPNHSTRIALLDEEGKYIKDCEIGEEGVLLAKGWNIFPGYKEEDDNKNIWIEIDGEKWYNSGDLAREDEEHYFYISGRKKELIIRGGHNIDPRAIEEPLMKHPAVANVAAIPKPDIRAGEIPIAYVELKPDKNVNPEELMNFAKENIGERAAIPKEIIVIENMPLTAIGKIFKPELKNRQIEETVRHVLKNLGISPASISFDQIKGSGMVAVIKLEDKDKTESNIQDISSTLDQYTIKYLIEK